MIKLEKLNPFGRMCVSMGMIPSSYSESLTYEEQLLWFCNYLEKVVIPAVNKEGEAIEELQALYQELKDYVDNYFENLDVQEEINNKLDVMAESGQLTDIIAQYLGLAGVLAYNTIADLKEATNIVNGSIMQTLGYHSINDGGKATYKAREILNTDVIDDGSIIALDDPNLVAELVVDDNINVKVFGAYGDNTHDDTTSISNAMIFGRIKKLPIYFPRGQYIVTSELPNMDAGSSLIGEDGFFGNGTYNTQIIDNRTNNRTWLFQYYQVDTEHLINQRGTCIKNLAFINNDDENTQTKWLINIRYILENVLIENIYVNGYERVFYANDSNDFIFRNIRCNKIGSYTNDETKYYAFDFAGMFGTLFDNIQIDRSRYMIKLKTHETSLKNCQTRFTNCHFEQTANWNCVSSSVNESLIYIDSKYVQTFENCMFVPADSGDYESNPPYMIYTTDDSQVLLSNCYFFGNATANRQSYFISGVFNANNCIFNNCSVSMALNMSKQCSISNCIFNCYINSDITEYKYIIRNNIKNIPKCENNILNLTLSGIDTLTKIPSLYMFNKGYSLSTSNGAYNISQNYQITSKWLNVFKIQQNYVDFSLKRPYKIKVYDMVNGTTFYYEGIFQLNADDSLSKIVTINQNGVTTYPINIFYFNGDLYVQVERVSNWISCEIENIEGLPISMYMVNGSFNPAGYTSKVVIDS